MIAGHFMVAGCVVLAVVAGGARPAWEGQSEAEGRPGAVEEPIAKAVALARDPFASVQVNVDRFGHDLIGDIGNEPSIAVDPTDPSRMVMAWRQTEPEGTDDPQAGIAFSDNGGVTWTYQGPLTPIYPRTDPVMDVGPDGTFYSCNILLLTNPQLFRSNDGGRSWLPPVSFHGDFVPWMVVDRTEGVGRGHIYCTTWSGGGRPFTRSTNGGDSFDDPSMMPAFPIRATMSVDAEGDLYVINRDLAVSLSTNAKDREVEEVTFERMSDVNLGDTDSVDSPNPNRGRLARPWIVTDHSDGPHRGNVYALKSSAVEGTDPMDVMFARSTDGGLTWSDPIRINDDPEGTDAWQWFGTMSIAPNGRLDVIWNDTRGSGEVNICELYYSFSNDGGENWSRNAVLTPPFDSWAGDGGLRDYYHMVSDDLGASLAYAATFNGSPDVYFLRIGESDCNGNGIGDAVDIADGTSDDCNGNNVPDECDPDCNGNGIADVCDIAAGRSRDEDEDGFPDECAVVFVNDDAGGADDGSSWEDAFTDLQDALLKSATTQGAVREIWVAQGTYRPAEPNGNRQTSFLLQDGLALYGGFVGTESRREERNPDPVTNLTVLSGDLNGNDMPDFGRREDNSFHVVVARFTGESSVLDGFTISGGDAEAIGSGGGDIASYWTTGGGMLIWAASPIVRHCRLKDNQAPFEFGFRQGGGALAVILESRPVITDCSFLGNRSASDGGAVVVWNSRVVRGDATFSRCTFAGNSASDGGAVRGSYSRTTFVNCTFLGNSATLLGGAAAIGFSDWRFVNCLFSGNSSPTYGAAIVDSDRRGSLEIASCTFALNRSESGFPVTIQSGITASIVNSILWNETENEIGGEPDVTYCDVFGGWLGTGNLDVDPLFVDAIGPDGVPGTMDDNLRLAGSSPVIDTGDPDFVPASGERDLDGHGRVLCDRVDMGGYEFGIGDFDCNRDVDLDDYRSWPDCMTGPDGGPYFDGCETFDFDFDGDVDLNDFSRFGRLIGR